MFEGVIVSCQINSLVACDDQHLNFSRVYAQSILLSEYFFCQLNCAQGDGAIFCFVYEIVIMP